MGDVLRKVAITGIILFLLTGSFLLAISMLPLGNFAGTSPPSQPAANLQQAASLDGNEKDPSEPKAITLKAKVSESLISELDQKGSVNVIVQLKSDANKENSRKKRYELSKKLYKEKIEASEESIGNIITAEITKDNLAILTSEKNVESVQPDRIFYASLDDSLSAIGVPAAWESNYTGEGVRVAILDTGVNGSEVRLSKDFSESGYTFDDNGHGTLIAKAIRAAAPKAELISAKVLDNSGRGLESSIISGINWAAESNAKIIVLSLGGPYSDIDSPLNRAVREASEQGVAIIAAAGNCGKEAAKPSCRGYVGVTTPGNSPYAITAGAVDKQNNHALFSSGENIRGMIKPDVAGPGVDVMIDGKSYSGTSVSAALTTGAAALVKQAIPELTPAQLKTVLEATSTDLGDEGKDTKFGSGVISLTTAVSKIRQASDIFSKAQPEQPGDKKVIDIGVVDLDLIVPEPLSPEAAMLEPVESSIKVTQLDRKGIVGILLDIISGKKSSYAIGQKVTLELEETIGFSQSGGKSRVYDYCELIVYPHYKKISDFPDRHKIRNDIEAGSGPWKITLKFTVLSQYAGPGEFQAWVWCNGGSPQYSWRGSTAKFEWEGIQSTSCKPSEPSISILWVQGAPSSVDYEAKVYNDLCEDYDAAYAPYVDSKEYPSVLLTPGIAPKGSRSNTGSIKGAFSEGSHAFKACLGGAGGDCDEESFVISASCTDNIGTVDACLNNPVGSRCDGAAECQNPYCVHNFCSANPYYCGDKVCDAAEDSSFCPGDCGKINCHSNAGCGADGYIDNSHCDADENVHRTYRAYTCQNPGTAQSSCKHSDNDKIIKVCGIGCSSGVCKESIACKSEKDCKNTGWAGTPSCSGSSVYQNYLTAKCTSPGQTTSSCEYSPTPTQKEACKEGCEEGSCISDIPFTIQLEDSRGNAVYKQPGDFVIFRIQSAGKQKASFTYPDGLTLVEGSASQGKASVEKGSSKLKFYIPEKVGLGNYFFSSGKTSFTVKVINEPNAIIVTDSTAMKDEFPDIGNSPAKVADVLAKAHELANEKTGIVYDLSEENLGERPWKSFDDYDEKLDKPKVTDNAYSGKVADFIKSKCSACSILILGDDFVVPFYRESMPKGESSENIYTDSHYISVSVPSFADMDSDLFFQKDPVRIVIPDYMNKDDQDLADIKKALVDSYHSFLVPYNKSCNDMNSEIPGFYRRKNSPECKNKCLNTGGCWKGNYDLDNANEIKVYSGKNITCDSFDKMDGATVIIIGDKKTNGAMSCIPWVGDEEYPVLSMQRNSWDGGKGAVILNVKEDQKSTGMFLLTIIVSQGGIYDYVSDATEMTWAEIGTGVAGMFANLIPGKSCVDAYDWEDKSLRVASEGELLWCSTADGMIIGGIINRGFKTSKAGLAASSGKELAQESGRLIKLGKAANYEKETAQVLSKAPSRLPYVSGQFEKFAGKSGREAFDKFFVESVPELAKMSKRDLDDFMKGLSELTKGPPAIDMKYCSAKCVKEIGRVIKEAEKSNGEEITNDILSVFKSIRLSGNDETTWKLLKDIVDFSIFKKTVLKVEIEGLSGISETEAKELLAFFTKGEFKKSMDEVMEVTDMKTFINGPERQVTLRIRQGKDIDLDSMGYYAPATREIIIKPVPDAEMRRTYAITNKNQLMRAAAAEIYKKTNENFIENYGRDEFLKMHSIQIDAMTHTIAPHELLHHKLSIFRDGKSEGKFIGLKTDARKELYDFEEGAIHSYWLKNLKGNYLEQYEEGVKDIAIADQGYLFIGTMPNEEGIKFVKAQLLAYAKGEGTSATSYIAFNRALGKQLGYDKKILDQYDDLIREAWKESGKTPLIWEDVVKMTQTFEKEYDNLGKLMGKSELTASELEEYKRILGHMYDEVSKSALG